MTELSPPRVLNLDDLKFAPRFEYPEMAGIAEFTGSGDGTPLGTGFARFTDAEIPWTVKYDEVVLVLEGTVTVRTDAGDMVAKANDCIWLPTGTALTYIATSALVFYAIHPSNWAETAS